ncbi:MAG: zinc ribbon domain-containing protein [Candidatus Hodarchaeales archaeon]|jgi:uncharacterized OB-fold protein
MEPYPEPSYTSSQYRSLERPRTISEIVSEAFNLYGKALTNFWLPFLIVSIIIGIIVGFITIMTNEIISDVQAGETVDLGQFFLNAILLIFLILAITIAGDAIATGIVVVTVKDVAENKPPMPLERAFEQIKPKIGALIVGGILYGIIVIIGFILLIIPGFLFLTWYYLFSVCIVLEDQSVSNSLERSKQLVSGDGWHTFGLILVSLIILAILSGIVELFVGIFIPTPFYEDDPGNVLILSVIQSAATSIVSPLGGIMTTLLYFDLKARKAMGPTPYGRPRVTYSTQGPSYGAPAKVCNNCGTILSPETNFCKTCGSKAGVPPTPSSYTTTEPSYSVHTPVPTTVCHKCGTEFSPGTKYCSSCGSNVEMPSSPTRPSTTPSVGFCPQCRTQLPSDAPVSFCSNCGYKL